MIQHTKGADGTKIFLC